MHKFYKLPYTLQWLFAGLLVCCGGFPLVAYAAYCAGQPWWLLLLPFALSWGQFCFTPLLKLTGAYSYLSPVLILHHRSPRELNLQGGTSFDYLFLMHPKEAGITARRKIIMYYVQGLLRLIEEIEAERLPRNITISGPTIYMSKKTAKSLGFKLRPARPVHYLHLFLNPVDLMLMYSFSQGRLTFPKFWRMRTAVTHGSKLVAHKQRLLALVNRHNAAVVAEVSLVVSCEL